MNYDTETLKVVNDIIKERVCDVRDEYKKLKAVDALLGEHVTQIKKEDLLNSISELQLIQERCIDLRLEESNRTASSS